MRHVSGRRPPHVTERSDRLIKDRADRIGAAEALADVVARLARHQEVLPSQVAGRDRAALERAAAALAAAEREWGELTPGERWVLSWPAAGRSRPGRSPGARGPRGRR
jgi:hypothetical protein